MQRKAPEVLQDTFGARKGNYRWIRVTADGFACCVLGMHMSVLLTYSGARSSELVLGTQSFKTGSGCHGTAPPGLDA